MTVILELIDSDCLLMLTRRCGVQYNWKCYFCAYQFKTVIRSYSSCLDS